MVAVWDHQSEMIKMEKIGGTYSLGSKSITQLGCCWDVFRDGPSQLVRPIRVYGILSVYEAFGRTVGNEGGIVWFMFDVDAGQYGPNFRKCSADGFWCEDRVDSLYRHLLEKFANESRDARANKLLG